MWYLENFLLALREFDQEYIINGCAKQLTSKDERIQNENGLIRSAAVKDLPTSEQSTDSGVSEGEEYIEDQSIKQLVCHTCNFSSFESRYQYEQHLLKHVCSPGVVLERLSRKEIKKVAFKKSATTPRKPGSKCPPSYIVPKFKTKHSPLKLTLKLAGDTGDKERSFEVVSPRKILLGPGERFVVNGGPLDCVKTEKDNFKQEGEEELSSGVEGSGEEVPAPEQSSGAEKATSDKQESDSVNTVGESSQSQAQEGENSSAAQSGSGSSEHGDEDFEPPPGSFSPNMVQVNGTNTGTPSPSGSPAFPSSSPNLPDTEQHISQHAPSECDNGGSDTRDGHTMLGTDQNSNGGERNASLLSEDSQHSNTGFTWTAASMDGLSNQTPSEERDPLMIQDQSQQGMMQGDENAGSILGLGAPPPDGGDPLLRGFLCEQPPSDKTAVPVSVSEAGGMEGLGLGSEYISLERLGEGSGRVTSGAVFCDVCGERSADHSALEEHRTRACHFKCTHTDCGGMVLPTADELLAHQNACHGGPPPPPPPPQYIQPVPVEQLSQQVQRLPVPPQQPQMQYMAPQEPPNAACRPPHSLYHGPSPTQMSPQPPPPAYGQQMVYGQQQQQQPPPPQQQQYQPQPQQYQPQPAPQSPQQRAYTTMMQQQSPQRLQQSGARLTAAGLGRGSGAQVSLVPQKRAAPSAGRGVSPNGKQRRLDVLLNSPNDDADCHVIAMQKRSDSTTPVIGSVQGGVTGTGRSDMIQLTDSITLSVRNQKQVGGASSGQGGGRGRSNANEVANVLASRGITVTPAADTVRVAPVQTQNSPIRVGRNVAVTQQPAQQVPTLNLNAAISIIRTDNNSGSPVRQRQRPVQQVGTASFAVPQGRSPGRPQQVAQVERPPRPPTVDLTGDGPPQTLHHMPVRRGRGRGMSVGGRFSCQICDKQFGSQEMLNQHMNVTHRSPPSKLPYRCNLCSAQYPTQQGLTQHRQTFHKEMVGNTELIIPVVDLKQAGALSRLANLGVHHYVPLQQLNGTQGSYFGLPLMSVDAGGRLLGSLPGTTGLSTGTVFNLGPLRQLPR